MTSDREYAEQRLKSGWKHELEGARRLLAALEREEKLLEAVIWLSGLQDLGPSFEGHAEWVRIRDELILPSFAGSPIQDEPHGNFEDTQDTNPEGGC